VEKPDLETARRYLASGDYFWNGGIFVWRVAAIEEAFARHAPELREGFLAIEAALSAGGEFEAVLARFFPNLRRISVDFAIMEKADNVVMIPAGFDWDEVGAWPAAARHMKDIGDGNAARGDVIVEGGSGNIVVAGEGHLVALVGCDDLVVIHTGDATLVCPRSESQRIKHLVTRLSGDPARRHLL
jgi:mannose-1-phosphate guanylyltransferase